MKTSRNAGAFLDVFSVVFSSFQLLFGHFWHYFGGLLASTPSKWERKSSKIAVWGGPGPFGLPGLPGSGKEGQNMVRGPPWAPSFGVLFRSFVGFGVSFSCLFFERVFGRLPDIVLEGFLGDFGSHFSCVLKKLCVVWT